MKVRTKAVSAVIATVMLLMVTVSLVGVSYVFSSTMAGTTTSSGSEQAAQLTSQLSSCMQIENIINNQITLKNCGKGAIDNKSLVVTIDEIRLDASTKTIPEGNSSTVNVSGLWQIPTGKHNLKISNGATFAQALVEIKPNPDGLVGSWGFDEGSGTKAYDTSGNGNTGTLLPTGSEPQWVGGKFGYGLKFNGANYAEAPHKASLDVTQLTIQLWIKTPANIGCAGVCWRNLVSKQQGADRDYNFYTYSSDGTRVTQLHFSSARFSSSAFNLPQPFEPDTWHNLILAVNYTGMQKYYYDGNFLNSFQGTAGNANSDYPLWIGRADNYWNGIIDEVRIWNRALSPDETVTMKQII